MLISTLIMSAGFLVANINDTHQTDCYRTATKSKSWGGLNLGQSTAVELCGGTKDSANTINCYKTATASKSWGGLGISQSAAVDLCRSIASSNRVQLEAENE